MGSDDLNPEQATQLRVQIDAQLQFYEKRTKRMKHQRFYTNENLIQCADVFKNELFWR